MSPEQIRGEEADKRADIWAFGSGVWRSVKGELEGLRGDYCRSGGTQS